MLHFDSLQSHKYFYFFPSLLLLSSPCFFSWHGKLDYHFYSGNLMCTSVVLFHLNFLPFVSPLPLFFPPLLFLFDLNVFDTAPPWHITRVSTISHREKCCIFYGSLCIAQHVHSIPRAIPYLNVVWHAKNKGLRLWCWWCFGILFYVGELSKMVHCFWLCRHFFFTVHYTDLHFICHVGTILFIWPCCF